MGFGLQNQEETHRREFESPPGYQIPRSNIPLRQRLKPSAATDGRNGAGQSKSNLDTLYKSYKRLANVSNMFETYTISLNTLTVAQSAPGGLRLRPAKLFLKRASIAVVLITAVSTGLALGFLSEIAHLSEATAPESQAANHTILFGVPGIAALTTTTSPSRSNSPKAVLPSSSANLSANSVESLAGFDGIGAIGSCPGLGNSAAACNPPDPIIAAGGSTFLDETVEMVNLHINVWKNLQGRPLLLESENLSTFWGCPSCTGYSDPKVLFDNSSQRFFASILVLPSGHTTLGEQIAASQDSDATGNWTIYTLPQQLYSGSPPLTGCVIGQALFPDQPIMGVTNDKIVLSENDYCPTSGGNAFLGAHFWAFNKTEILSGANSLHLASFGPFSNRESIHPAQSLSSTSTEYMVSTGGGDIGTYGSIVAFYAVNQVPPGNVSSVESDLSLNSVVSTPTSAIQKGTTTPVWCPGSPIGNCSSLGPGCPGSVPCNDARVLDAKWSQGKLWYSLNEDCTPTGDTQNRTCVRMTEIDTTTTRVIQDFDYAAAGQYYYYPALSIDASQSIIVVYGFSNSTTYPSIAVTGQGYNDPVSTMRIPQILVNGRNDSLSGRYGDYFGAATDRNDPSVLWVAGEYIGNVTGACLPLPPPANAGPCWSTRIASVRVKDFSISANPNPVNVNVNKKGSSTITVSSVDGFQGTVNLTVSTGLSCSLSKSIITLGTSGTATLSCSSSTKGSFPVVVTGKSGTITKQINVTFNVT